MVSIDKIFDMVYYINMDEDVERNENILEILKKQRISKFKRISGFKILSDFGNIPPEAYRNFNKKDEKYVRGSLGCRWSHLYAIKDAKNNRYKKILILEDDIQLRENLIDLLIGNYYNLQNFDMLYFGGLEEQLFRNQIVTTHCYALSEDIYDDILNMAIPSGMEIDNFYAKVLQHMSVNNRQGGQYIIKKIEPFNSVIQDSKFQSNIK